MPFKNIENLSSDTVSLLNTVIKKQEKKVFYENRRNYSLILGLFLLLGFFVFLNFAELHTVTDPLTIFARIMTNPSYLTIIMCIAITFFYHHYCQKKLKKAKDKLNATRAEVIDHLNDTKDLNLQDNAPIIKKLMKDEHDINLYVKNK